MLRSWHWHGRNEPEKLAHARKLNMIRRHLTKGQRDELIKQQLKETPELSDRRIAESLGVDKNTIAVRRQELESTGEIHQLNKRIGADGKERRKPVSVFNPTPREERALKDDRVIERMKETGASAVSARQKIQAEDKAERKASSEPEILSSFCHPREKIG